MTAELRDRLARLLYLPEPTSFTDSEWKLLSDPVNAGPDGRAALERAFRMADRLLPVIEGERLSERKLNRDVIALAVTQLGNHLDRWERYKHTTVEIAFLRRHFGLRRRATGTVG